MAPAARALGLTLAVTLLLAACLPPTSQEADVAAATNAYRQSLGLPYEALSINIQQHARDVARWDAATQRLLHSDISVFLQDPSLNACGENIYAGPGDSTGRRVVDAWRASPPHDANLRNPAYTQQGTGVAFDSYGRMWVVAEYCG